MPMAKMAVHKTESPPPELFLRAAEDDLPRSDRRYFLFVLSDVSLSAWWLAELTPYQRL
jgi:hypothetical protein